MTDGTKPVVRNERTRVLWAGCIVAVVAVALRVALLPTARFGGDEALFFNIGMDIVQGRAFPSLGTQITDGAARLPGPAFLYLMSLPLLVWRAPEAQYLFVEVLGALTVVVLWNALRRPFGLATATIVGLLVACAPWSALYADRTWNPNVMPLVVTLAFSAAIALRHGGRDVRSVVTLLVCGALLPQLHTSAPVAWAGLAALIAWPGGAPLRAWPRRGVVLGLAIAALCYVPLFVHEAMTAGANTRALWAETIGAHGAERHATSFLWVPVYAARFLTLDVSYHELTGYWGGPDEVACLKAALFGSPARPFHPVRCGLFVASLVFALASIAVAISWMHRRRRVGPWAGAFACALLVNLVLLGAAGKQVFGHYVTCLQPFVFVAWVPLLQDTVARASTSRVSPSRARVHRVVVGLLVASFLVGGVAATIEVSRRIDGRIGLAVHRRAIAAIVDDARARGLPASAPVRLDLLVRSSMYDWQAFATRAARVPFAFDRRATQRRFVLAPSGRPAPSSVAAVVDLGFAQLWRIGP